MFKAHLSTTTEPRADPSIPDYLRPLTEIANQISGMPAEAFEQLMVTEYAPGAGIGWHRDRPAFDAIVGVSFLAPCTLRLRRKAEADWERRFAHIDPRSAYLLVGPVRNSWQHSIAPMDVLRYSVTLRSFRPGHGSKDQPLSDTACAAVLDQRRLGSAGVTGEDAGSRSVSF